MAAAAASSDHDTSQVESKVPKDIQLDSSVVDICFHPSKDVIAACTVASEIFLYSYGNEENNHELMSFNHHKKPCRGIKFSSDGQLLFSISKDKSLQVVDLNTGAIAHKIKKAHESPIYSLLVIDDYLAATGDDEGVVKVWDYRRETPILEEKQMENFISCLATNEEKKFLIATSGDGTMTTYNVRAKRMEMQSVPFDSDLLSVAVMKRGTKVVVGSGEGALNIFNWGEWSDISDRFPGHPSSIDCIAPITESIICTGSIDGQIRAVNILPNRFMGIVGEHEDPVEALALARDDNLLASCSQDETIKFWDVSYLHEEIVSDKKKALRREKNKHLRSSKTKRNFFADLES